LTLVVSFYAYFNAENVRGFMLLYEVVTVCLDGAVSIFWVVTPRRCVSGPRHFEGRCRIHLQEFQGPVNSAITRGGECVMAQAVCDWPVTKEAWLQS
jgi:hypothetical protein